MVKKIFKLLIYSFLGFFAIAFFLPSAIHVQRSTEINAPANFIFEEINDFTHWKNWSPWHAIEPNAKWVYSDSTSGVGAYYTWEGKEIGNGKMINIEVAAPYKIRQKLEFDGMSPSMTGFYLENIGDDKIKITWTMDTDMGLNPINRWMGLFFDKMLGSDYEKGLSNLKTFCEKNGHQ
jgi:hypothetical protein